MSECDICGGQGKLGRYQGKQIYCACEAGIAAELEDRDRVLQIIAEQIEAAPKFDKAYSAGLQAHFNILRDEYDELEKTLHQRETVTV